MKKALVFGFILSWVTLASYGVTLMHSWHYSDLSPKEELSFTHIKFSDETQKAGVIHFLTPLCSCSKEIFKHLVKKGPLDKKIYLEKVVLIDDLNEEFAKPLIEKGFDVHLIESEKAKHIFDGEIRGVPLLTIYGRDLKTQYVGGYSDKSITPFTEINYRSFLEKIEKNLEIKSLPVIGCAVSKEYKKLLDPFGLKYGVVQ